MEGSREWFNELPRTDGIYRYIEQLKEGELSQRIQAAIALGKSRDPRAVRPLTEHCGDDHAELRRNIVEALCRLESVRSVGALNDRLKDRNEDWVTRRKAADGLGTIRSYSAIDSLVERLLDEKEDTVVRTHVAEVLGHTGSKKACEALKCLSGETGALQASVEEALRKLGVSSREGGGSGSSLPFTKHLSSLPREKLPSGSIE